MTKERFNFHIAPDVKKNLVDAKKMYGKSYGDIINNAIRQQFSDIEKITRERFKEISKEYHWLMGLVRKFDEKDEEAALEARKEIKKIIGEKV